MHFGIIFLLLLVFFVVCQSKALTIYESRLLATCDTTLFRVHEYRARNRNLKPNSLNASAQKDRARDANEEFKTSKQYEKIAAM